MILKHDSHAGALLSSADDAAFDMIPYRPSVPQATSTVSTAAVGPTPTIAQELQYIDGLNPNGTVATANSFWTDHGLTAFKYGSSTAGTGATISFAFDPTSNFTQQEKTTVLTAMANWEAAGNITFVEDDKPGDVSKTDLLIHRGNNGAATTSNNQSAGSGATLGHATGQVTISIDTAQFGFDLSGSFVTAGGYGLATMEHELGHFLGFGHGGNYNGNVMPATDQFSAFDDRQYTTMSYISWTDGNARYASQNPYPGTNWGPTSDGMDTNTVSHTIQILDIEGIQQLYGVSQSTPFSGGQTYGFNSNIVGLLHNTYDFTVNTTPVVTLYNQGIGNTLDVSGYSAPERIDLHDGSFSDVGSAKNNVAIAIGTKIDTAIGGDGNDTITANNDGDVLKGGAGADHMIGGTGNDTFFVDNVGDVVTEAANGGTDTVQSTISYTLGDNVENLYLLGTGNISATGNALGNVLTGNSGNNVLDGGAGADTASYTAASSGVHVDLSQQGHAQDTGSAGLDTLISIENILGSNYNDTLTGDGNANTITAGAGNDTVTGNDGNDTVYGNVGNDTLFGNVGDDYLNGGQGNDLLNGGKGNDTLVGGVGDDTLVGGAGTDTLTGNAGADTFKFNVVGDSTSSAPDVITDFQTGVDKIDLSALHTLASDSFQIVTTGGNTFIDVSLGSAHTIAVVIEALGVGVVNASDVIFGTGPAAATTTAVAAATVAHSVEALMHDATYDHVQATVMHDHVMMA